MNKTLAVIDKHSPPPHDPSNPYSILGLQPGALPGDNDFAYKTLAKKFHPDKDGGYQNFFNLIQKAKQVLLNPVLLHMYEQYGVFNPNLDRESIYKRVRDKLGSTLQNVAASEKIDVRSMDLIAVMVATLEGSIQDLNGQICDSENNTVMCNEVISRLSTTAGKDVLVSMLIMFEEQVQEGVVHVGKCREEQLICSKAIELLKTDFKYHVGEDDADA